MDRCQAQVELDRLWMGHSDDDHLRLPPAWVLVHYQLAFEGDMSTRPSDVTDEEINACL